MKSRKVKSTVRSKAFMKKLKSTIPLDTEENSFDENEYQESEDDDSQEGEDSSNEEEVLPITDDENSLSEENQEESSDNEDDLPNLDNWGKKKSLYYNADFIDKDRGKTYRDEDLEMENAEREAASLQLQTATELDRFESSAYFENYDRSSKLISKEILNEANETDLEDDDMLEVEKLKHEKRKYPKLSEYKEQFKDKFAEVNDKLAPLVELADSLDFDSNFAFYIKMKYQILLHYLLNISFYLYLKSTENVPDNHPIYERIEHFKQLDEEMNSHKNYQKEINVIIDCLQQKKEIPLQSKKKSCMLPQKQKIEKTNKAVTNTSSKKKEKSSKQFETEEEKEILALYKDMKEKQKKTEENVEDEEMDQDINCNSLIDSTSGEKRTITYQIAKNKGLVPRRKKEYRNPRVHHRMKFRKAKIRRKGQVREVVKEIKRYAGEPTGISAHVVRSVKLR